MNNDLIERYIYAVTKRLPKKTREDVSQELRGLIDDMLSERCEGRTVEEKDIRVVLTELGSPRDLYAKYDEDAEKSLIGPGYYSTYKFVAKIVLIAIAVAMTISCTVLQIMEPRPWYGVVGMWLSYLWEGVLGSFGILTLVFAILERKGIRLDMDFNFDDLPPVPKKNEEISKWDCIFGIGLSIVFTVVFLVAPQVLCTFAVETKELIPIFSTEAIRGTWYIILMFAVCGISREVVSLVEGRYNKKVLVATLIDNLISAVLTIWWMTGFDLINPKFASGIETIFAGNAVFILEIFRNFQLFFMGVVLFALALDTIVTTYKTLKK